MKRSLAALLGGTMLVAPVPAIPQSLSSGPLVQGFGTYNTVQVDVTRAADTTTYTVNTAYANSKTVPTAGGFTLAGACRTIGGGGMIVSASVVSSDAPTTPLQGEIWPFNQAVTAINDNANFSVSDADMKNRTGQIIPFTLQAATTSSPPNTYADVNGPHGSYKCVGTVDLRFLIRVTNAYGTPGNAAVLTVILGIVN